MTDEAGLSGGGRLPGDKEQPIAAVLADVDGTLVPRTKELTPRTIRAIRSLHERGTLFAITSGRPPRGMFMLIEPLGLTGPMAAFNGGILVLPDLTVVDERSIPADVAADVIATIRSHGLYAWIYRGADWFVTDPHAPHAERESRTVRFQPTVVPSYDGLLDRVVKIVGVSDDHDLVARCEADVQARYSAHVSAARSQAYYLDVTHPTANKGVVVERLSRYYRIPLEQVVTVGDQPNDVLMFVRSGMSVAMGNASPEVQRQATYVTASNEEDGFAQAIEQYVLPRAVAAPPL
ncbi:Cof-type HAD-IIB family hydrolase [Nonomuraea monospora]|uniref:Cof-type HAD-IIB family hydrolase n=1 Tax=Nonomuraea monospora TaxID=568818 RepID=A0ABN3C7J8_9ACTN